MTRLGDFLEISLFMVWNTYMGQNFQDNRPDLNDESQSILEAFIEHRDVLFSYFARKLLKPEDIEDLLHDTFMVAFKSESNKQIKSPKGYLFVVARNLLSKKFAKDSRMRMKSIDEADFNVLKAETIPADQALHYKVEMEALINCIETLPKQCRKVFIYKKFHGLSQKQISSKMQISTSTVERHITIALLKLRTQMSEQGYSAKYSNVKRLDPHKRGQTNG